MSEPKNAFGQSEDVIKTPDADKIITVEVLSDVGLDGQRIPKGLTTKISIKQWRALSRHFKWIDGPEDHNPANKSFVEAATKAAAKAARAAVAILALLLFAHTARAVGPPSQYGALSFTAPTNGIAASTTTFPLWQTNSAGQITNGISLTKFDEVALLFYGQETVGVAGFTNTWTFYGSPDANPLHVDTNTSIFTFILTCPSGTNGVLYTNISRNTLGSIGYLIPGKLVAAASNAGTNLTITPFVKPIRNGN